METVTISTLDELREIAREILQSCVLKERAQVIALRGELGAGKTAFVKELVKYLKVPDEVTSPTFVVMKSYPVLNHPPLKALTHIDAYRIESEAEMEVLGFEELLTDPSRLICIEWPEKIKNLIPKNKIDVQMTLMPDGTRKITYGC